MTGTRTVVEMRALYDRTARHYDVASFFYRLTGIEKVRSHLIAAMALPTGGTVVDLGTGTGVNLKALAAAVGSEGKVIGVDLSPKMLARARKKVSQLPQVELIESDVREFHFPEQVDGVISTFALEFVPEYAEVLATAARSLPPGKPLGLMGLKYPEQWPEWLAQVGMLLNRSFGVREAYKDFKPWIAASDHCQDAVFKELCQGSAYVWLGSRDPMV